MIKFKENKNILHSNKIFDTETQGSNFKPFVLLNILFLC